MARRKRIDFILIICSNNLILLNQFYNQHLHSYNIFLNLVHRNAKYPFIEYIDYCLYLNS